MAQWLDMKVNNYAGAVQAALQALGQVADARKCLWCNYPVFFHGRDELEEKTKRDTKKLEREIGDNLRADKLWYVGIPRFRLIRRGTPYLNCEVDLHYIARAEDGCWFGKIIPKADIFDVPLCLIAPLVEALAKNETEIKDVRVVERASGYTVYEFGGREWKVPDAFLGFAWALAEKGEGFEGLLDRVSCALMDKFTKELPSPETPRLVGGNDYEQIVSALRNLGCAKDKAEEAANYVMAKFSSEGLENKVTEALKYLGGT